MTFNIRFDNEMDGLNAWPLRRELVTGLIKKYNPSILGTQEGMWSQLIYLRDHLQGYRLHSPQRTIDAKSQYPTLFFHSHQFEVHDGGEFWLSLSPNVHLSKDWDSAFPRMMSYARVSTISGKGPFWLAVTHLDHIGAEARYQQAKIIADWVNSALMVTANEANHEKVVAIIAELDKSNIAKVLTPKTVKLTHARASDVANLMNEMIRRSKRRDRKTGTYPITVSADDSSNTLLG